MPHDPAPVAPGLADPEVRERRRHGATPHALPDVDAAALERDLSAAIPGEVRFGPGDRAMHAVDAGNFRHLPVGIVTPRTKADVIAAVAVCRAHGAPIVARGGGTSLAGQTCNVAVVLDFSRHQRHVLWVDPERRVARVQPGVTVDQLRAAVKSHDLWWGPDPATHYNNSFGGMIANNSCGVHALTTGRTAENVVSLEILTYDGTVLEVGETDDAAFARILAAGGRPAEIYGALRALRDACGPLVRERYPRIPRRISGYNLDELLPENDFQVARALVGTEGTCALTLEATVRLVPLPKHTHLVVVGYPSVFEAADDVVDVLETQPLGLEGIDDRLTADMRERKVDLDSLPLLPDGKGWLFVEYGGRTQDEARQAASALTKLLAARGRSPSTWRTFDGPRAATVWTARESGQWATALHPERGFSFPGWEDAAVPPDQLAAYLRDFYALLDEFGYTAALFGHFGQGCIHCNIDFDLETEPGIERYRRFLERAADLVARYHGSNSGEHGDGQQRGELLARMFGDELVDAMRRFKAIWDPTGHMNPGKVVDAHPLDADLRLGAGYRAQVWEPATVFRYPDDDHSFSRAAQRCIGVGKCRRPEGGTMCPSYKATHEERHSTRGRTHLLWEMMQSDSPVTGGWKSEEVKEALDLCLSCKGCKAECPMQVDVATYKAEFLHHYWKGRVRPRIHLVFGRLFRWARVLSIVPGVANALVRLPVLGVALRTTLGFHPDRPIPPFAPDTFEHWFRRRRPAATGTRPKVALWADTWTNHLWPEVGMSTVELLEAAGWEVVVLEGKLCCGRPLFEYGLLTEAKRQVARVLDAIEPLQRLNIPLVVLEPSCGSVFVDEARSLFPDDPRTAWLAKHAMTLDRFLSEWAGEGSDTGARLDHVRIALHQHCHHKASFQAEAESRVLSRLGAEVDTLASGCCGMAGGFGFEQATYDTSVAVARTAFLPEIEKHTPETVLVSGGYSCRSQAADLAHRPAFHLAQVVALARGPAPVTPTTLKADAQRRRRSLGRARALRRGIVIAGAALITAIVGVARRR